MNPNPELLTAIKTYFSKDNIALILSILGCIGSLLSWLYIFFQNRKCFDMEIIGHLFGYDQKSLLIFASFTNKSHLPITITNINVKLGDSFYTCAKIPVVAHRERTTCKGEVLSQHEHMSLAFPITLQSLGGVSGYILFEFPESVSQPESTQASFVISTNRGRSVEKKLSLGRPLR